jgi:hypothetical protein
MEIGLSQSVLIVEAFPQSALASGILKRVGRIGLLIMWLNGLSRSNFRPSFRTQQLRNEFVDYGPLRTKRQ